LVKFGGVAPGREPRREAFTAERRAQHALEKALGGGLAALLLQRQVVVGAVLVERKPRPKRGPLIAQKALGKTQATHDRAQAQLKKHPSGIRADGL